MNMKKWGKIALTAAIAGVMALAIAGCTKKGESAQGSGDGQKKVVNVAFTNYYVPYDFVNDKGEPDGYEVAVMQEIAKKLPQYDWKFTPTSDDDLLIGVESGKYTLGTKGVWMTDARKKKYIFPKNYLGVSVIGLVIRKDMADQVKDMDTFAAYSGKLVPIAPQDARYMVVDTYNKEHPNKPIQLTSSEAFQIADAYSWVMEGRYDGYLEIELSFQNNVTKDDAPYHKFADQLTYIRYKGIPTYPLFNKNEQKLADEYDKALQELKDEGKIAELQKKYFGEDLTKYVKD